MIHDKKLVLCFGFGVSLLLLPESFEKSNRESRNSIKSCEEVLPKLASTEHSSHNLFVKFKKNVRLGPTMLTV
jgi:hypothetical protein